MNRIEKAVATKFEHVLAYPQHIPVGTRYLMNRTLVELAGETPNYIRVFATSYVGSTPPHVIGARYQVRFETGETVMWNDSHQRGVHPEIRDEDMPPPGAWITNQPDDPGFAEWVSHAHETARYEIDARAYRLLAWSIPGEPGTALYIERTESDARWYSPLLWCIENANRNWDAVLEGKGW